MMAVDIVSSYSEYTIVTAFLLLFMNYVSSSLMKILTFITLSYNRMVHDCNCCDAIIYPYYVIAAILVIIKK